MIVVLNMSNRSVCTKGCFYSTSICFWLFCSFTLGHRAQVTITITQWALKNFDEAPNAHHPLWRWRANKHHGNLPIVMFEEAIVSFPLSITTTRRTYLTNHDLYLDKTICGPARYCIRCEFVLYDEESWWHAPKAAENFRTLWSPSFSSNAPPWKSKDHKIQVFTEDYFLSREFVSSKTGDYDFHSLRLPGYQVGLTRLGQQRNQRPPLVPQKGAKHAKAALPPVRDVWGVSCLTSFSIMMCNMTTPNICK